MTPAALRRAARSAVEALEPVCERDWSVPAGTLEWTCRATLEHTTNAVRRYAQHLANRSTEPLPLAAVPDQQAPVIDLLRFLDAQAGVLAEVVTAAPADARGWHRVALADPSGFAAMGADEILVHTGDITEGLGVTFDPPPDVCRLVLDRLFPWAPEGDPWTVLRWANGRIALQDHEQRAETWVWHCAPLTDWDGTIPVWPRSNPMSDPMSERAE